MVCTLQSYISYCSLRVQGNTQFGFCMQLFIKISLSWFDFYRNIHWHLGFGVFFRTVQHFEGLFYLEISIAPLLLKDNVEWPHCFISHHSEALFSISSSQKMFVLMSGILKMPEMTHNSLITLSSH